MQLKRLSIVQTEKDYLQNILLYTIYSVAGRELIFKGGTCLYKVYGLNRFSEDLDFSLTKYFDFEKLVKKILFMTGQTGLYGKVKTFEKYQNQFNINMEFKGPLYSGNPKSLCFIGLDISMREKPFLSPEKQTLNQFYKDIPAFDIFTMDLREILVEKIAATHDRKKPRDVYDIWFLLKFKNVQIDYELLQKKLKKRKISFEKDTFLHKIQEKEPMWKGDLTPLIASELPPFDQVKKEIEERL
ncbi:MAG: nucleotidyl transferase AbiEii/AbiGii toxin family protein [Candidatus Micrarchaeota archaeon]|nr:nucleotidyl transferase AbiEii/AbiGii toxin family protein [Candidatus Micrarchaeota archaeon]